jgi:hypothetical protein
MVVYVSTSILESRNACSRACLSVPERAVSAFEIITGVLGVHGCGGVWLPLSVGEAGG